MSLRRLCLLFVICSPLLASVTTRLEAVTGNEIRVHLTTASPLFPLYLGKCTVQGTQLSQTYIEQLCELLAFDLNLNGYSKLVASDPAKEALLKESQTSLAFSPKKWKEWGILCVVRPEIRENTLSISLLQVDTETLRTYQNIPLSGNLSQDRQEVHRISDTIQKTLFQTNGIATTKILYAVQTQNAQSKWVSEIWEIDWDGGNPRQVTHEGSYCITPVFLPALKGKAGSFLYVSYKNGQPKICIASLKEGVGRPLVSLQGNQLLPAVSPKRDMIAFISDAAGRTDLFLQPFSPVQQRAAKPIQLFSFPRSTQASPTFSPDGSQIAFVSDKDGPPRLYTIPTRQVGAKRPEALLITKKNQENSCPSWSPDGRKLAYSAKTKGVRQIWVYDFDTQEEHQLTDGQGNKENPCWAPDSLHLVFNSTDASSSELYLVNLNQPQAVKITQGGGKKHYPAWGMR